ncbi:MAG: hypothetical protein WKF73_11915 [Nocardioidaceae bacterium]
MTGSAAVIASVASRHQRSEVEALESPQILLVTHSGFERLENGLIGLIGLNRLVFGRWGVL